MLGHLADPRPIMNDPGAPLLSAVGFGTEEGPFVEVGVGIDFGAAFVGNIGHRWLWDFTAVGEVVNTAAALEAQARGGGILMSDRVTEGGAVVPAEPAQLTTKAGLTIRAWRASI